MLSENSISPTPGQPQSQLVHDMFQNISTSYDKANNWISMGRLHSWRKSLVRWSEAQPGHHILDCATGTGDLAFEFAKKVLPTGQVQGLDFVSGMIDLAKVKAGQKNVAVNFAVGDATSIPFADQSFDICSIAFGLRNVEDPILCLREMARVTKKHGHVMILETGETHIPGFRQIFSIYYKWLMPKIGGYLSGKPEAYNYLQKSSANFPYGRRLVDLIGSLLDFESVQYHALGGGVCYMYKLRKK